MGSKPEGKRNGGGSDMFGLCSCAGSRSTRASGSCAADRHTINLEIRDEERAFRVPSFGSWHERRDGVQRGREDAVWGRVWPRVWPCVLPPLNAPVLGPGPNQSLRKLRGKVVPLAKSATKLTIPKPVGRGAVLPWSHGRRKT